MSVGRENTDGTGDLVDMTGTIAHTVTYVTESRPSRSPCR